MTEVPLRPCLSSSPRAPRPPPSTGSTSASPSPEPPADFCCGRPSPAPPRHRARRVDGGPAPAASRPSVVAWEAEPRPPVRAGEAGPLRPARGGGAGSAGAGRPGRRARDYTGRRGRRKVEQRVAAVAGGDEEQEMGKRVCGGGERRRSRTMQAVARAARGLAAASGPSVMETGNRWQLQQSRGIVVRDGNLELALLLMERKIRSSGMERLIRARTHHHVKDSEKRVLARKALMQRVRSQELGKKLRQILIKKIRWCVVY
ncbi:LOW QUALITY PROTEIN: hypothetical protein U9M48_010222 [Paspalum notatum var. saurae]|uniref:Ribosomal protein S21 n=1 Tax=Paspalum notatum var. saurae TaxID=547442 RepID=A0AAQ3STS0_PASNO